MSNKFPSLTTLRNSTECHCSHDQMHCRQRRISWTQPYLNGQPFLPCWTSLLDLLLYFHCVFNHGITCRLNVPMKPPSFLSHLIPLSPHIDLRISRNCLYVGDLKPNPRANDRPIMNPEYLSVRTFLVYPKKPPCCDRLTDIPSL